MFGRRRRAVSNPAFKPGVQASASAHTAAAQAFINSQVSNGSLSAAAAAAALRSRPMSPTSVADVQTKRTMRRNSSVSSVGSSVVGTTRGPPGAQLERRLSSGSMTERTFRDPSPVRGSARPSLDDAPPVPALPRNITPSIPAKSHRRAASVEIALPRVASPPPNLVTGRGSSLGPFREQQAARRNGPRNSSISSAQELTNVERPNSRGSVNFSYPTGAREMSPYGQRRSLTSPTPSSASQSQIVQKQNLVYDPNTRSMRPAAELLFYEQAIQDAAERPVKKKKKVAPQGYTGTHLTDGTVGGRIQGSAVNNMNVANKGPAQAQTSDSVPTSATSSPVPRRQKKTASTSTISPDDDSYMSPASDYESDSSEKPTKFNTRAGMLLARKPSTVREERELEEAEDNKNQASERQAALRNLESRSTEERTVSPSPKPRTTAGRGHGRGNASASKSYAQSRQQTRSVSQPAPVHGPASTMEFPTIEPNGQGTSVVKINRVQSLSPPRSAHFLKAPESSTGRHQPPARSISPRKSALKHSPSSRGSSPAGGLDSTPAQAPSETSDTSLMSEDRNIARKKSVRVSFDESNVVLGQSNTSPTSDPASNQGKRGWFSSIGRGKKKDSGPMSDEEDEIMKPRPALPSFGSVRDKKPHHVEERALVKPSGSSESSEPIESATVTPPIFTNATGDAVQAPIGQSSDHAVGAVIAHDQASKDVANVSTSNEPLPPEVTSVEGSGYVSDDASSIYSVDVSAPTTRPPDTVIETPQNGHGYSQKAAAVPLPATPPAIPEYSSARSNGNGAIPSFALTKASPTSEEMARNSGWPNLPGQFRDSSEWVRDDSQHGITEHHPTDPTPAALGIAEPEPIVQPVGSPAVGEIASENIIRHPAAIEEESESDESSIYSDAAEDLSDMQGDGFMSLDAVLESPIVPKIPGLAITTPPDSPTARLYKDKSYTKSALSQNAVEPEMDEGWQKAQQHWRGLTVEKKNELERAARDNNDADSEKEVAPVPKPKKTRKVVSEAPPRAAPVKTARSRQDRTYQIVTGAKAGPHESVPTMKSAVRAKAPAQNNPVQARTSMRADNPVPAMKSSMRPSSPVDDDATHMRSSMRGSGPVRSSLRNSAELQALPTEPRGSLQKKYRPMAIPQTEVKPDPVQVKKHIRAMSGSSGPAALALKRRDSGDSDSSFKRARPVTEGYNMMRSMRGPREQPRPQSPEQHTRSSRFSLRSLSPSTSRTEPPTSFNRTMRHTRQFSNDSSVPTLRSQKPERALSPRRFGFGKSKPAPKARDTTRSSRFADSSDEEDARPSYRSRFVDSSDDEAAPLPRQSAMAHRTTMRSAPRRSKADVIGSSDLPDTDDEKPFRPIKTAKTATVVAPPTTTTSTNAGKVLSSGSLRRSGSGRETMGATTTTSVSANAARPEQKRRSSFMSILRRKKPDPASKVHKSDIESAARRDTPLERTPATLLAVRQDSYLSQASGTMSPKLQKRNGPSRTNTGENWPLPRGARINGADIDGDEDKRPSTADAAGLLNGKGSAMNGNGRPEIGSRRATATGLAGVDMTGTPGKKKKKFGALRRAFGLDD